MKEFIWLVVSVFLFERLLAQKGGCQDSCSDYHRMCPAITDGSFYATYESYHKQNLLGPLQKLQLPPIPNCSQKFYQVVCPRSCRVCTPCVLAPGDLADLASKVTENQENIKKQTEVVNQLTATSEEVTVKVEGATTTINQQGDSITQIEKDLNEVSKQVDNQQTSVNELTEKVEKCCGQKDDAADDSPTVEEDGYKLIFRHTSNQLTIKNFVNFFLKGILPGAFSNNIQSSQFKEPSFFQYWHDTSVVRLDAFDMQGKLKKSTYFNIPARDGQNFVTWSKVFQSDCELVAADGKNKDYAKIHENCKHSVFHSKIGDDDKMQSAMFLATSDDCENQKVFFMLHPGIDMGYCDWQKDMRAATVFDNSYTVAFYNTFQEAVNNFVGLNVASKFEIRISGAFADNSNTNGFIKAFRYTSYSGIHVMDYFQDGTTDPLKDRSQQNAAFADTSDMYRVDDLPAQIENAEQILFVIYDESGFIEETLAFKGSGDLTSWFSRENLISTLNWDFTDQKFDYFDLNIPKRTKHGRYFIINTYSWTCRTDEGFFLISCKKDRGNTNCAYERMVEAANDAEEFICMIQFTRTGSPVVFTEFDKRRIGEAIEIFVKPKEEQKSA